jgi:hypothetical protein
LEPLMSQVRWNKIQTPTNSDSFTNLTTDLATEADTANVVVKVSSLAEANALAPPSGKYAGMVVSRTDLPGAPVTPYDGANWSTQQVPKFWANNPHVGSASNLLTNLQSGAIVPIFQGGTIVCTTDANGYSNFTFPQAFPNGLFFWMAMNADDVATGTNVFITQGSANATLSTAFFNAWKASGSAYASQSIRLDWFAAGW